MARQLRQRRPFGNTAATDLTGSPTDGAATTLIRGPGVNNWDVYLFKNFPLHGDRMRFQFRLEMYNAFNHTQFSALNTTARFDASD